MDAKTVELRQVIINALEPYTFGEDGDLTPLSDKDCYQWIDAIISAANAHYLNKYLDLPSMQDDKERPLNKSAAIILGARAGLRQELREEARKAFKEER